MSSDIQAIKIAALVSQAAIAVEMLRFKRGLKRPDRGSTASFEIDYGWQAVSVGKKILVFKVSH